MTNKLINSVQLPYLFIHNPHSFSRPAERNDLYFFLIASLEVSRTPGFRNDGALTVPTFASHSNVDIAHNRLNTYVQYIVQCTYIYKCTQIGSDIR